MSKILKATRQCEYTRTVSVVQLYSLLQNTTGFNETIAKDDLRIYT